MSEHIALLRPVNGTRPEVDGEAWLAPTAALIGDVHIAARASVWYGAVLRGDRDRIQIGVGSNLQDGVVVHGDPGRPTIVGEYVSVGHRAVLHGCRIGDGSLIGMSATILNGAEIGEQTLVAAGAVVLEGTIVPPRSLVAGVPAKVRRELTEDEISGLRENADRYHEITAQHAAEDAR
jgi:carbonic anhydrase/acetyltransferase-like protein (isoleucine patch superfamily)